MHPGRNEHFGAAGMGDKDYRFKELAYNQTASRVLKYFLEKKGIALTQEEAASLDISARTGKSGESLEKSKHHSDVISEAYLLSTDGDFGEMAAWLVKQEVKQFGKTQT